MKVLWLCNMIMPLIAEKLNIEASNKEGWLSGLLGAMLEEKAEGDMKLSIAFPVPREKLREGQEVWEQSVTVRGYHFTCYGFLEDVKRPEIYDEGLENRMREILRLSQPELVHCFGTEYPHTLAMCRVFPRKDRLLIGIQGLCAVYADAYFASMPERAVRTATLRDRLKRDSIIQQQQKFERRGKMETEAVRLAGNVCGRTDWDRCYTREWNPGACYFEMNETLRQEFYEGAWDKKNCVPHLIFLSQGDYPVKGLHYMLQALPTVVARYPDTKVCVAGNSVVKYETLKQKLKISGYGRYLRELIRRNSLEGRVIFLGMLDARQMKEQYLKSHLFVCCSSIENSPNSLGEAMLLGMPCVCADVGGIPSIFADGEDGILYDGFRTTERGFDNMRNLTGNDGEQLENIAKGLANAILEMWADEDKLALYCKNARRHAEMTHDRKQNYNKMKEIYMSIAGKP